jgi:hypothetical protein
LAWHFEVSRGAPGLKPGESESRTMTTTELAARLPEYTRAGMIDLDATLLVVLVGFSIPICSCWSSAAPAPKVPPRTPPSWVRRRRS